MAGFSSTGFWKLILLLPVLGYVGLALFAFVFANRLAFPAPPPGYADSPDIRKFTYNEAGRQVSMVYLEEPGSPFLVYYHHGNGEDLQGILPRLQALRKAGFSVLAWDYPGYGTSDGRPSEKLVNTVAEQIWQTIPGTFGFSHDRVILYGRSLGGGPATFLASRHRAAGLVLEGAFTSIFRVGTRVNILPWDIFDNLALIGSITCPALFIHGTDDETVPFRHGRQLWEKAPEPKFFAWLDNGRHNDLIDVYPETYYSSLLRFRDFLLANR